MPREDDPIPGGGDNPYPPSLGAPPAGDPINMDPNLSGFMAQVAQLYKTLLKRIPSLEELQGWVRAANGNYDLKQVEASIKASPEFSTRAATATGPTNYTLGTGFVPSKLNDPNYYSGKYSHALKDQFLPAMQNLDPTEASLDSIVSAINAKGGHATRVGKDNIDFGDGAGPIDVIFDVGGPDARWAFQNTTGNAAWEKANGIMSPAAGGGAPMSYADAIKAVNTGVGRTLSQQEIDQAFAKFGGNAQSTFTSAGLQPVIDFFKTQKTPTSNPMPGPGPYQPTLGGMIQGTTAPWMSTAETSQPQPSLLGPNPTTNNAWAKQYEDWRTKTFGMGA